MKLHRLELTNYRGIAHREIDFPEHGVVVVHGANEIGKTSMIEALDLLLESKDRSTKKDVKQVKPTHADVGSEVLAEISTGPYRFVYRKRFHKKCETELTILAPRREQLTGDEAHERVRGMLEETVDLELWRAQRVLQAASTASVDLSGCDALSRALDVAAGDPADSSDSDPLLIDRIDLEYARYFTPTGRPTGEWLAATTRVHAAEQELDRCTAAVAEVDERVRRHAALTDELARLAGQRQGAAHRRAAAQQAAAALAELTAQLRGATLVATAARAKASECAAVQAERIRLCADVENRAAAVAPLTTGLAAAALEESTSRAAAEIAAAAAVRSAAALADAQAREQQAQRIVAALAGRAAADRLAAQLQRIEAAESELAQIGEQLAGIALTDDIMADIDGAVTLVQRCEAQLALSATSVEFTAAADLDLTVDGQSVRLAAGERWAPPTSAATTVELPGLLSVRIDPGATTAGIQADLEGAQRVLAEVLEQGGVTDVDGARSTDRRRRALLGARDQLSARLTGLRGGDDVDEMRARLTALRAALSPGSPDAATDESAAQMQLAAAREALAALTSQADADHRIAVEAEAQLAVKCTQTTVLREKLALAEVELTGARERLAAARATAGDDELAARTEAEAEAQRRADASVAELAARHAAASPDDVEAELMSACAAADALEGGHAAAERALNDIAVELGVMGSEGRQSKLDAAAAEHRHASAEADRVSGRARSAELLRSVMVRHRDNARQRYVEPFRAEIERLGRPVFGPTFEVEIDSDLRICNRTLDGCTVPYDSLSGGAKEQLGIVARLAGAALVAKEDTVPVVIDDALGFTDPERLARMGAVFDTVGNHGQVIVLTCTPDRYLGVEDAQIIALTA